MPLRESMVVDEGGRLGTSEDEASKGNAGSLASPFQRREYSKLVLLEIFQNKERREEEKKRRLIRVDYRSILCGDVVREKRRRSGWLKSLTRKWKLRDEIENKHSN